MFSGLRHIAPAAALLAAAPALAQEAEAPAAMAQLTPPRLVKRVQAAYPEEARKEGLSADVLLQLVVGADGRVTEAQVVRGAGHGFDEAALEAARQLVFEPARHGDVAIPVQVNYEVHFALAPPPTLKDTVTAEPAPAPEPGFEATVRAERPFTAASATTVRDRDFLLQPRATPEDILRVVPGLVLAQHQGGGKADQLFLRGFDADHGTDVAVSLDGIPVNMVSHAHGQGYADLHFLIPEVIERVEIEKGPYSAEHGDFDTAGAVNLVTRERFEKSQVSVAGGSFDSMRVLGIAGADVGALHPWFAGEVYATQGPFQHGEELKRYNVFAKASADLSPATKVSLLGTAYASSWNGSGQIPARLVDAGFLDRYGAIDPTEGGSTQRQQAIVALSSRPDKDSRFEATLSAIRYGLTLYDDFTFQAANPAQGDEIEQTDRRLTLAANLKYVRVTRDLLPGELVSSIGLQYRNDESAATLSKVHERVALPTCGDGVPNPCVNTIDRQTDAAAFVQEDWRINRFVRLVGGLRADLFLFDVRSQSLDGRLDPEHPGPFAPTQERSIVSPKASVVVTPKPWLDLFLNFGSGFHSNDARSVIETPLGTGSERSGNLARALPRALGSELGVRARLFDGRVDLAAALWQLDLASELVWNGDDGGTQPGDPTRRYGLDLEGRWAILPWLFADVDVSLAHGEARTDAGNGNAIALAPPVIVTGGLTARHPSGFAASLRVRHLGDRPGNEFTASSGVPACTPSMDASDPNLKCFLVAQDYTVVDATLAYTAARWALSLMLQNVTNTAYREAQFVNDSQVLAPPDGHTTSRTTGQAWVPEAHPVRDIHFTPGNPFGALAQISLFF